MSFFVNTGESSVILRIKLLKLDNGQPLTGLTFTTTGLGISIQAMNAASATVYTAASSNIEDITTLGTYAAPSSGKCRFKEVDATTQKGIYEIHFLNSVFNTANSRNLHLNIYGVSNLDEGRSTYTITQNILGSGGVQTACSNALTAYEAANSTDVTSILNAITAAIVQPPELLITTTIDTLTSQTNFTIVLGSEDDTTYVNKTIVVTSAGDPLRKAYGTIATYDTTASVYTVTLTANPGVYTMAVGDTVEILAYAPSEAVLSKLSRVDALDLFRLVLRNDAALATDLASMIAEINTDLGSGPGGFDHAQDSQQALRDSRPSVGTIVDAMWDEAQSAHVGAGTFGEMATEVASVLEDTSSLASISTMADAFNTGGLSEPTGDVTTASAVLAQIQAMLKLLKNEQEKDESVSPTTITIANNDGSPWLTADRSTTSQVTTRTKLAP